MMKQEHSRYQEKSRDEFNVKLIVLEEDENGRLPPDLFSTVAQNAAKWVASSKSNKPSQLRKFYDEISMWNIKIKSNNEFERNLPFILMIKAKVAYAKGRDLVDEAYEKLLNHCLSEIERTKNPNTLHNCKLFLEAFTGFYKQERPTER